MSPAWTLAVLGAGGPPQPVAPRVRGAINSAAAAAAAQSLRSTIMAAQASTDRPPSAHERCGGPVNPSRNTGSTVLGGGPARSSYFGTGLVPTVIPGLASHFQLSISVELS